MRRYLWSRLTEEGTWIAFGVAIVGASVVPPPLCYGSILCGCVAALLRSPSSEQREERREDVRQAIEETKPSEPPAGDRRL